eukprot:scaffold228430_cov16-Tisochrysis_lutea.AAC.1
MDTFPKHTCCRSSWQFVCAKNSSSCLAALSAFNSGIIQENEKEDTGLALSFGKTQEDGEKDSEALSQGTGLQPWRQEKQRGSYLLSGNLRLVENLRYSHAICMILEV